MPLDRAAPVDLGKEVFVAEEGKKFYLSDTSDVPTDVETAFQSGDFNGPHVFVIFYTKPFIFWYILKHILKPIRFLHKTVICAYSARLNHPIYFFGPRIVFPQPRAKMVSLGPRFSRVFRCYVTEKSAMKWQIYLQDLASCLKQLTSYVHRIFLAALCRGYQSAWTYSSRCATWPAVGCVVGGNFCFNKLFTTVHLSSKPTELV